MKENLPIIEVIIGSLALLINAITMIISLKMLKVAQKEISPKVSKISDSLDTYLEKAKRKIYNRYFSDKSISRQEFDDAVLKAYEEIMLLIPNLDTKGKQDEDYYLGEWLCSERTDYDVVKGKTKEEIAYLVYTIRSQKY